MAGDEAYPVIAHSILWLYTILCNHKVWKWNQSDSYHRLHLQGWKKSHVMMKRQGNGYQSQFGVDRSAV